jgi:hypothetical protein
MLDNCPFTRNEKLLNSRFNITFGEAVTMTDNKFRRWCVDLRKEIIRAWDEDGIPPLNGRELDDIVDDFKALASYDISTMSSVDENLYTEDCILNNTAIGSSCNQFFPTMLKTKDIHSSTMEGKSVYDTFASNEELDSFVRSASVKIRDDGMYVFSNFVEKNKDQIVAASTGKNWIVDFSKRHPTFNYHDYWLMPQLDSKRHKGRSYLSVTKTEVLELMKTGLVKPHNISRTKIESDIDRQRYRIRIYDNTKKIFPKVFNIFKMMTVVPATNFPPLTARYVYEKFTEHIKDKSKINVYDPSAGWGGRILGAMATHNNRNIHYIGTDPNSDHWIDELEMTKYEYLASYFNSNVQGKYKNTYELFSFGSEVVHKEMKFKKYKGKIDFIFTSPPYFAAEGYSDDDEQSFKKFPTYKEWRDGFLFQTLKTAVDYLANDRYLCWNIADVLLGNDVVPLERDSIEIIKKLGLEYKGKLKMVLAPLKGKRQGEGVRPVTRNFARIGNQYRKYEPIFIFYKK